MRMEIGACKTAWWRAVGDMAKGPVANPAPLALQPNEAGFTGVLGGPGVTLVELQTAQRQLIVPLRPSVFISPVPTNYAISWSESIQQPRS